MSRSRSSSGSLSHWRDLDVAQMPYWPNAPRRWVLAIMGLLICGILTTLFVSPRVEQLNIAQKRIQSNQQQIIQLSQVVPKDFGDIPEINPVASDEENLWLTSWAQLARKHQLETIDLKIHEPTESEVKQGQQKIETTIKEKFRKFNKPPPNSLSSDWLNQVALLNIAVQGSYGDILAFAQDLGLSDQWLGIESAEVSALDNKEVRWQAQLWFYREAKAKRGEHAD